MKKKSLFLKKEVIADLTHSEMDNLVGGASKTLLPEDSCICLIKPQPQTHVDCEVIPPDPDRTQLNNCTITAKC